VLSILVFEFLSLGTCHHLLGIQRKKINSKFNLSKPDKVFRTTRTFKMTEQGMPIVDEAEVSSKFSLRDLGLTLLFGFFLILVILGAIRFFAYITLLFGMLVAILIIIFAVDKLVAWH
jgi:hypothetical protein